MIQFGIKQLLQLSYIPSYKWDDFKFWSGYNFEPSSIYRGSKVFFYVETLDRNGMTESSHETTVFVVELS